MSDESRNDDRTIPATAAPTPVLEKLDRFELIRLLGAGGVGEVYLARDTSTEALVAVKKLQEKYYLTQQVRKDFVREFKTMAAMSNSHILAVIHTSEDPPYYVMPYVESGTLGDRITKGGVLPIDEVIDISLQVAEALKYIHDKRGTTHRDIKPVNVLLTDDGHAYISDFGLVRPVYGGSIVSGDPGQGTQWTVGTMCYMAPEVMMDNAGDARSDLYSLGVMMFEMVTGRPPIIGSNFREVLDKANSGLRPKLIDLTPSAPEDLEHIIDGLLAVKLRDRYSGASDLITDLIKLRNHEPIQGPHDGSRPLPMPSTSSTVQQAVSSPVYSPSANVQPAMQGGAVTAPPKKGGSKGVLVAIALIAVVAGGALYAKRTGWVDLAGKNSQPVQPLPPLPPVPGAPPIVPPNPIPMNYGKQILSKIKAENNPYSGDLSALVHGKPPLVFYSDRGDWHTVGQVLLKMQSESQDLNQADSDGLTALHAAAGASETLGAVQCIDEMVGGANMSPDLLDVVNGQTPLHVAAFNRRSLTAKTLLDLGANPNAVDNGGQTPLHVVMADALQTDESIELARLLLTHGADRTLADHKGNTPESLAAGKSKFLAVLAANSPVAASSAGATAMPVIASAPQNVPAANTGGTAGNAPGAALSAGSVSTVPIASQLAAGMQIDFYDAVVQSGNVVLTGKVTAVSSDVDFRMNASECNLIDQDGNAFRFASAKLGNLAGSTIRTRLVSATPVTLELRATVGNEKVSQLKRVTLTFQGSAQGGNLELKDIPVRSN